MGKTYQMPVNFHDALRRANSELTIRDRLVAEGIWAHLDGDTRGTLPRRIMEQLTGVDGRSVSKVLSKFEKLGLLEVVEEIPSKKFRTKIKLYDAKKLFELVV